MNGYMWKKIQDTLYSRSMISMMMGNKYIFKFLFCIGIGFFGAMVHHEKHIFVVERFIKGMVMTHFWGNHNSIEMAICSKILKHPSN